MFCSIYGSVLMESSVGMVLLYAMLTAVDGKSRDGGLREPRCPSARRYGNRNSNRNRRGNQQNETGQSTISELPLLIPTVAHAYRCPCLPLPMPTVAHAYRCPCLPLPMPAVAHAYRVASDSTAGSSSAVGETRSSSSFGAEAEGESW